MVTMNDEVFLLNDNNGYFHMLAVGTILFRIRFLLYSSSTSWSAILLTPIMMPYSFSIVKWSILEKSYVECTLHGMHADINTYFVVRWSFIYWVFQFYRSQSVSWIGAQKGSSIFMLGEYVIEIECSLFLLLLLLFLTLVDQCVLLQTIKLDH